MDKTTFVYMSEVLKEMYDKLEDSFTYLPPEEEIPEFNKKVDALLIQVEELNDLRSLITDVHNQVVDLQNTLANYRPKKEEEEEDYSRLEKVEIPELKEEDEEHVAGARWFYITTPR